MTPQAPWPRAPYKGLSFYGPDDIPLFGGRDDDIAECAHLMAHRDTRVLIMQGPSGCGKTSFLRAGLIPFLEGEGFLFRKADPSDRKSKAIFVTSTDVPLMEIAEHLYEFIDHGFVLQTPDGKAKPLDLSSAKLDFKSREDFCASVGTDGDKTVLTLEEIAKILPYTLVVVVDQAEQVLTLRSGPGGDRTRAQFFDFVRRFSKTRFDLKLMVALRTDFYEGSLINFESGVLIQVLLTLGTISLEN